MEINPHIDPVGHETGDVNVRDIVITLACLAVGAGLVCVLVYGIFRYLADHPLNTAPPNPMAETERQQMPPVPRIEEHPAIELKDLRTQEDKILSTYGWTDKRSGIVRIPIERAMDLQLQRGFPTRQAKEGKQ
ncbi:MAG TPA: hypothetical protein VKR43_02480 [Bryobacteraceae bacterium]|nr:hypothetical protein [Bryobacteraceae bacterium]